MKLTMNTILLRAAAAFAAVTAAGCIQLKTESEIKPIHITMDINLKVDKSLDKAFQDENVQRPQGDFVRVKDMLDRQAAGITRDALLEARASATDASSTYVTTRSHGPTFRMHAASSDHISG